MSEIKSWPESLPLRTAEEWTNLGANWSDAESRTQIVDALKGLKIPATEYARKQPPERVELIIKLQESLKPGSTTGGKKPAAAAAAPAATAAGAKKAAPKAGTTGTNGVVSGGGATVDLTIITEKLVELDAKIDSIQVTTSNVETLLKLILLNPAMVDSLQLASDPDVLAEFSGKTIGELAGGNG